MRQRRTNTVFPRLFDQREPILFLLGAIFLGVLGNACYSLLLDLFGDTLITHLGTVLVLLAIVSIIISEFWAIIRRRRPDTRSLVPREQEAEPHAGLILPISPNPQAADRRIIEWHLRDNTLRHCWMIVSRDVEDSQKFRDLTYFLLERNVQPYTLPIDDPDQANLSYAAVKQGVLEAQAIAGATPVIVDITGGRKPMTAGTVLACRDYNVPVQYLTSRRDKDGNPIQNTSVVMKVELRSSEQLPDPRA